MIIAEKIREVFNETCQRSTRPRRRIADRLAELALGEVDFTIDDLWQDLRRLEPCLGRATLYRSIEILVQKGILDRIEFADGTHRYHVCGEKKHYHLTCRQCHCFVEVEITLPIDQVATLSSQTGFAIEELSLTLFGLCAQCRMHA